MKRPVKVSANERSVTISYQTRTIVLRPVPPAVLYRCV